jgi:acetyl esterase/lipase
MGENRSLASRSSAFSDSRLGVPKTTLAAAPRARYSVARSRFSLMKQLLAPLLCSLLLVPVAFAGPLEPIALWPGTPPGDTETLPPEQDTSKPTDKAVGGKPLIRLGNVSKPTMTVFPAPKEKNTGAAVVVCPGGGYNILALDLEGTEVCEWLNSIGVTGVLLKYRVPARKDRRYEAPLQDAQRALGLVRQHASEWGIDSARVGILGFSAGGHLAANASNNYETRSYSAVDDADKQSCRPDFSVLIYPAYLTEKDKLDQLSPELKITERTPQTFLAMTQDDPIHVEGPIYYSLALKQAKVPFELHVYPTGGHGYGLRPSEHNVTSWPARVADWMKTRGLINPSK